MWRDYKETLNWSQTRRRNMFFLQEKDQKRKKVSRDVGPRYIYVRIELKLWRSFF